MKKVKAPKAKNMQPVILTMDCLIEIVNRMNKLEQRVLEVSTENSEVMDLAANAYPERTTEGLKFKYFTEDGGENFVTVRVD